jgi:tripartite-type tricarboxylate transporter receptor subunit TctC
MLSSDLGIDMRKFITMVGGAVAAAFCTVSVSPVQAQDAEKAFYAGKTVRMIVGSGVGGGYDVFSRLIAPHLARTLGTTVIVENVPGAGGLVALNRLYVAPPDGLTISLVQATMATPRATDGRSGRAL